MSSPPPPARQLPSARFRAMISDLGPYRVFDFASQRPHVARPYCTGSAIKNTIVKLNLIYRY
jgi:hypothetical protein